MKKPIKKNPAKVKQGKKLQQNLINKHQKPVIKKANQIINKLKEENKMLKNKPILKPKVEVRTETNYRGGSLNINQTMKII